MLPSRRAERREGSIIRVRDEPMLTGEPLVVDDEGANLI
jgi:hypothetical protein